jgi:hypothetical protein
MQTVEVSDSTARRAARKAGLDAKKSRNPRISGDNYGGFMLVDERNNVVGGERFTLSAAQVVDWCRN